MIWQCYWKSWGLSYVINIDDSFDHVSSKYEMLLDHWLIIGPLQFMWYSVTYHTLDYDLIKKIRPNLNER